MQGVYKAKHWLFYIPLLYTLQVITVLAAYINAGSKTEFTNDSLNSPKIRKLNIDTLIISQGLLIHEKTRVQKFHATVPLSAFSTSSKSSRSAKRNSAELFSKSIFKFAILLFNLLVLLLRNLNKLA